MQLQFSPFLLKNMHHRHVQRLCIAKMVENCPRKQPSIVMAEKKSLFKLRYLEMLVSNQVEYMAYISLTVNKTQSYVKKQIV